VVQTIEGRYGGKIMAWVDGVSFEEGAQEQAFNVAALPFIHEHVAIMPDTHSGYGAAVGSVIPTKGAIIPYAVGVDIGCLDGETEFLSSAGWKRIDRYVEGDDVLVYDTETGQAGFETPRAYIKKPSKGFLHIKSKYGLNQALSDDHRMLLYVPGRKRLFTSKTVEQAGAFAARHHKLVQGAGERIKTTPESIYWPGSVDYTDAEIRVIVMTAADARMEKVSTFLNFRKRRKFDRALELLEAAGVEVVSTRDDGGVLQIRYRAVSPVKGLDQLWGASPAQLRVIAEEVLHWDGNADDRAFFTRRKEEADFVQWAFIAAGKRAVLRADPAEEGKTDYRVFAHENTMIGVKSVPRTDITRIESPDGLEYCFTVSTGFFMIRRGGVTALTGNCGMAAVRTTLTANDLPDTLAPLRSRIERAVPHGGPGDKGSWKQPGSPGIPDSIAHAWVNSGLKDRFEKICQKHPVLEKSNNVVQLGTLGGGNHFIEICIDTEGRVWVMLHSGSRGVGNVIGTYFVERAKEKLALRHVQPLDKNLAWLEEGEQEFDDYVEAMLWAQDFARLNRDMMMVRVLGAMREKLPSFQTDAKAVNTHHNFAAKEHHFGEDVWVTRKGAVSAQLGELGIIPGSMGAKSFIVRGKGHADAFCSCSHGAGRMMSRGQAKREITLEDHARDTAGVECRKDAEMIDESPKAYKPIELVMAAQTDMVEIVATLKQILCVKG